MAERPPGKLKVGWLDQAQEAIAFAYHWPPDVLDDLTLDQLELWAGYAKTRIEILAKSRCAFG